MARKQKSWLVFRFDDKRIRKFQFAGEYEVCLSNGIVDGVETHLVEVPFVEGEARRKAED